MNKIFKTTVFGLMVSIGAISTSNAQFEMNSARDKVQVESIPFVVALRKIVPIDYDFSFETNADLGQVVSYEYQSDWSETLSSLLSGMELDYRVDGDVIYVSKASTPVAPVVAPAPVVAEVIESDFVAEVVKEEVAPKVEVIAEEAVIAQLMPVIEEVEVFTPVAEEVAVSAEDDFSIEGDYIWKVRQGFTLQETMKSWGEQVDWTVIWDTDRDFDIQSEVSFTGSFVDAASDLINAFAEADPPVVGTFYKNNTLVIETTSNGEVN